MSTEQLASFLYRSSIERWLRPDVTALWMLIVSLHVHVAADVAVFAGLPSLCVSNLQNAPVLVFFFSFNGGWLLFKPHNKLLFTWITVESGWPAFTPPPWLHAASLWPTVRTALSLSMQSVKCQLRLRDRNFPWWTPKDPNLESRHVHIHTYTHRSTHTICCHTLCTRRQS